MQNARTRWQIGIFAALLALASCGEKDEPKGEPTATKDQPTKDQPTTTEQPAGDFDVSFLVDGCGKAGFSAEQCKCAGELAKKQLDGALVAKMEKAPGDNDPKLEGYYTSAEINKTMAWVEKASDECGFEDAAEEPNE